MPRTFIHGCNFAVNPVGKAKTSSSPNNPPATIRPIWASGLFHWSRWRLKPSFQHTLFWGGLRGALALALALAVPVTVPERDAIILTAFAVVAFSILVQGLTMPWLIKRLDLGRKPSSKASEAAVAAAES